MIFVSTIKMNREENFEHLLFVTEACNLDESVLIFIEHTDNWTSCQILNLVTTSL